MATLAARIGFAIAFVFSLASSRTGVLMLP
jgi:hypothetical protein